MFQKKEKEYEMHIYQDFGGEVYRDGREEYIFAYICENKRNKEIMHPRLTQQISVWAEDSVIAVEEEGMDGDYLRVRVWVAEPENKATKAIVTFQLVSEYGIFTNHVSLKIVDEIDVADMDYDYNTIELNNLNLDHLDLEDY